MTRKARVFLDREQVMAAMALRDAEKPMTNWRIAKAVGMYHGTVDMVLAHRDKYDPYDDDVAIERALKGDRDVYDALTPFEYRTFLWQVHERIQREPSDSFVGLDWWLRGLCNDLGTNVDTMQRLVAGAVARGLR